MQWQYCLSKRAKGTLFAKSALSASVICRETILARSLHADIANDADMIGHHRNKANKEYHKQNQ